MTVKTSTWYSVACDVCGDGLDDGEGGSYYPTAKGVLEYARDLDCWWIGSGENPAIVCESRDEEHKARAREIAAELRTDEERAAFRTMWPDIDLVEHGPRFAAAMPGQSVIGGV